MTLAIYAAFVVCLIAVAALDQPIILLAIPVGFLASVGVLELLIKLTNPQNQKHPPR